MDLQLRGKCAIVCAASRGLGRATALSLAREGASVAICARNEGALIEAAAEIRSATGALVVPVVADVGRGEDALRLVDRAAADEVFPRYRAETEANPEAWWAWLRLALAYDASGDRRRARSATRRAIALERSERRAR